MATEAAFDEMFRRFEPNIYAYCARRFTPSLAEDVVAEVFAVAWRKFSDAPIGDEALPWLYRIAFLTSSNQRRRLSTRRTLQAVAPLEEASPGVADEVVVREELRTVLDGLGRLRPQDREILRLAAWEGLETREIATVLGVTSDAAAQRLHRARKRLVQQVSRRTAHQEKGAAQ